MPRLPLLLIAACVQCTHARTPEVTVMHVPAAVAPEVAAPRFDHLVTRSRGEGWYVHQLGHRVLVQERGTLLRVADETNGTVVSRTLRDALRFASDYTPVVGNLIVGQVGDGAVVALDATTLADVWSFQLAANEQYVTAVAGANAVVVVAIGRRGPMNDEDLVVLDGVTGRLKWQRSAQHLYALAAAGPSVFIDATLTRGEGIVALDATTGAEIFRHERLGATHLFATPSRVITMAGDNVTHILDAKTGAEVGSLPVAARFPSEVVFDHDVAYVYSPPAAAAVAIDLATAKPLWRWQAGALVDVQNGMVRSTGGTALTATSMLLCTSDGVVHALDRRTASEQWSVGLGHCNEMAVAEGSHGTAAFVQNDQALDVLTAGRPAPETATISGLVELGNDPPSPVANATVVALGATTTSDARGRYTLRVRGQGKFIVQARGEVPPNDKCDSSASGETAPVDLSGKTSYEVNVTVTQTCSCGL